MRIGQARVSPSIAAFSERFLNRYGLRRYRDPFAPALFFGVYTDEDLWAVRWHQGPAVVAWAGTDALKFLKFKDHPNYRCLWNANVRHAAISKFVADDLDAIGLPYKRLPLCCVDVEFWHDIQPTETDCIYTYIPSHSRDKYGAGFVEELSRRLPECYFIINDRQDMPADDVKSQYRRAFVGVRPTAHDGLSNTVIEMGLMGRRVLWNGDTPNAIPFASMEDAVEKIRNEMKNPPDRQAVASAVRAYIDIGGEWKNVSYWFPTMRTLPQDTSVPYDYAPYFDFRYEQGELGAGGPDPNGEEAVWTRKMIYSLLEDHGCDSVLEVGCGSMARWKYPPGRKYVGIDVSEKAILHAARRFPDVELHVMDATTGDLPEADAILCIDVMQHIKPCDVAALLQKMRDAARKLVIVKTSVNIMDLYYQFNHDWEALGEESAMSFPVPGVPVSHVFVFDASGGRGGLRNTAAVASPAQPFFREEEHADTAVSER